MPIRRARPRTASVLAGVTVLVVVTATLGYARWQAGPLAEAPDGPELRWPPRGQAAVALPGRGIASSRRDSPVPIASVAKIMTALVVLERFPLDPDESGFSIVVTRDDVEDTELARARGESLVAVRAGEVIHQREALLALMLPSANNMARILATRTAGSEVAFVRLMNARARSLGLTHTHYADASGFSAATISTARDQTRLATIALQNATFAWVVRQPSATIPVSGWIRSTDELLGSRGFVGVKTGSHRAAGGCFVFAAHRRIDGTDQLIVGAVLGQRGPDLVEAAFEATERLVDSAAQD